MGHGCSLLCYCWKMFYSDPIPSEFDHAGKFFLLFQKPGAQVHFRLFFSNLLFGAFQTNLQRPLRSQAPEHVLQAVLRIRHMQVCAAHLPGC